MGKSGHSLKPHLWLIRLIGIIVPRRLRLDWRQEWEAELRNREAMLAEWDRLNWQRKVDLLWRSSSAFWDALWMQSFRWEDEMIQDLRYAFRTLRTNPGFTFIAVLTLALGIGINAAIFSVVDGVLLRPLPYKNPHQLVRIWSANQETGQRYLETSYQDFQQFKAQCSAFVSVAAFSEARRVLRDDDREPSHITIARVSESLFSVLNIAPALGRDLLPEEYERGDRSVIISHRLWQSRYAADPHILGRTLIVDADPHLVVGVLPAGYDYPPKADLWRPLTEEERQDDDPELLIMARLAPGVTIDQAGAEVATVANRISTGNHAQAGSTAWVQTMQAMLVREVQTLLLVLLGAVGFVLLIACANVANLLLARGLAREHEISIRAALGARRGRIVRQLLTESILVSMLGGLSGLLLGAWALKAIVVLSPDDIPRLNEVSLDWRVIIVMITVTLLAGIIFGLVPALYASRLDLNDALKGSSRNRTSNPSKHRLRKGLVIAEMALASVLLVSAGLLIKSFSRLLKFDRGFRAENVLVMPLNLRGQTNVKFDAFYEQALEQVNTLSSVESASLALQTPMETQGFRFSFQVEGTAASNDSEAAQAVVRSITPDYFKTVSIPLLSGRSFNDQDRRGAPLVAIVNETFAKSVFSTIEPVGQRLRSESFDGQSILIVGVSADVNPEPDAPSRSAIYLPFRQFPVAPMSLLVRSADDPTKLAPMIRDRVRRLNRLVPLDNVYTLEQKVGEEMVSPRFTMMLVGLFAALGMTLAAIGIYGVMSYAVTERTKEIGIRRALGANETSIVFSILRQGVALALLGLAIGLALAVWSSRLMAALLFNISATDPTTFVAVASLLTAVALLACYIPARRATKVDPLLALRHE